MTKRIFRSICFVALGVFLASVVLFMGMLYNYFEGVSHNQLKMQTDLAARAVTNEGMKYLEGLDEEWYRITWIGTDGSVLYDSKSDSDEMENHFEREEIKEALAEGVGESSRYSAPLMVILCRTAARRHGAPGFHFSKYPADFITGYGSADCHNFYTGCYFVPYISLPAFPKNCRAFEQPQSGRPVK